MKVMMFQSVFTVKAGDPEIICMEIRRPGGVSTIFPKGTIIASEHWIFRIGEITYYPSEDALWYESEGVITVYEAMDWIEAGWELDNP